ncbi:MAG: hypothetical protein ACRELD_01790 [Longimicrobiales bacterium]
MNGAILILAVFGVLALLRHILRAVFVLARRGVDAFLAGEAADVRARRGDLTGLEDAERNAQRARRARVRASIGLAVWSALLVAPPFTEWTAEIYAACAMLWLFGPAGTSLRPLPTKEAP